MNANNLEHVGPGHGPGGSPLAIAISPVLTGRDAFGSMRDRILEAAPGTRLIPISAEGVADEPVDEVEVLLRGWSLGSDALDRLVGRAPKLRWIHSVSVGVESMLTPCVRLRGLTVTNGRGVFSVPIAEYVMTMILAICRRLPQLMELQRERTWQPIEALELADTTIGLLSVGGIGREVARLAGPFGPRIVAVRRRPDAAPVPGVEMLGDLQAMPELLAVSDFVVLALPLTGETEALIDDEALASFKPGGWLINVARGALVDEMAMLRALRGGRIGGAVLDTFREEPLPETSPFYRLSNCIVTPHTSWSSAAVLGRTFDVFCDNLRRYRASQPLAYLVDLAAGY
ncbi:MAG TPA: D-2-hydroxyacid dehydrogenase [Candidatus Limnocylindrales bacterium]|nr:D-2-hydroxyacid dehydrogenase [Candidatus Limnocylindrales bacterium]